MKLKARISSLIIIFIFMITLASPKPVQAQAYATSFSTAITYQNVGSDIAHVTILIYTEGNTTPISISRPDLPPNASTTVSVGTLGTVPASFKGSAVIKSDVNLAVTMTEIPGNSSMRNRPMASGFITGAADLWFLSVNKTDEVKTVFSVQNIDTNPADLNITFYSASGPITLTRSNIAAGGSVFFDTASISEIGASFSGNVHIQAVHTGSSVAGKIIGTMMDLSTISTDVAATESMTGGSQTIYMPYAFCNNNGMNTSYYVFNPSLTESENISVSFSSGGVLTNNLPPATGGWFSACSPRHTPDGYNGYAVINSNPGPVLAMGRVKLSGMSASFLGEYHGSSRIALPLVNWTVDGWGNGTRQQTWVTVQNIGGNLDAGAVTIHYYDKNGGLIGSQPLGAIPNGGRVDSNGSVVGANEFGYYTDGSTGGSVIVEGPAGSQLMAIAWAESLDPATGNMYGDIYNGFPAEK
jgi:aspartate 1-decarboxylase